ncbi:unnamed protein product [Phyllotreta striolata]|uniref:HAUS augmin-like complex subunit 3 N-terminal domain-containing protein n=1 Tax=Phyllotreta striolata TaxID=444603 RepID=A0A9N9XIV9_PHYSR|nr:unnamed protein product [Phyllotreta striolata]
MGDNSGERLLKVFDELNIDLLNLNRNVVKAWFDADNENQKELMNWMCTSLSQKNYVSPLDLSNFSLLDKHISKEVLENELLKIEDLHPGIFDEESNALEIEYLEEELKLVCEIEKRLNQSMDFEKSADKQLKQQLAKKSEEKINTSIRLQETEQHCIQASENLDKLHSQIYDKLCSPDISLYATQNLPSTYISSFPTDNNLNQFEILRNSMEPMLYKASTFCTNNFNDTLSTSLYDTLPNLPDASTVNEMCISNLDTMKNRLISTYCRYFANKIELKNVGDVLKSLDNFSSETLLTLVQDNLVQNISMETLVNNSLCNTLEDTIKRVKVDQQFNQTKIKFTKEKFALVEMECLEFTDIENIMREIKSNYALLGIMYNIEEKYVKNFETALKQTFEIVEILNSSISRTNRMKDIIERHNNTLYKDGFELMETIFKSLSRNDENFDLNRAVELYSDFNKNIDYLESKHYCHDLEQLTNTGKRTRDSIKELQTFLISGPTTRIVLIPTELQSVVSQLDNVLEEASNGLRSTLNKISKRTARIHNDKWEVYRRQLWMYFYSNPDGLKFILECLKNEFKNRMSKE